VWPVSVPATFCPGVAWSPSSAPSPPGSGCLDLASSEALADADGLGGGKWPSTLLAAGGRNTGDGAGLQVPPLPLRSGTLLSPALSSPIRLFRGSQPCCPPRAYWPRLCHSWKASGCPRHRTCACPPRACRGRRPVGRARPRTLGDGPRGAHARLVSSDFIQRRHGDDGCRLRSLISARTVAARASSTFSVLRMTLPSQIKDGGMLQAPRSCLPSADHLSVERRACSVREVAKLRPCAVKSHLHDAGSVMLCDAENGCVRRGLFGRVEDKECFAIKVDVKALAAIDRGEIGGMCNHRMIVTMRACIRIA
jgi:hypothetical protein